jgi:hypothetical protein
MAINGIDGSPSSGSEGLTGVLGAVGQAVESGISAEALGQAQQAAQGLKNAASSGQLRITEEGFNTLMTALNQCDDHLLTLRDSVHVVKQAPQLGSSPYAQTVSAHVQKGGTGGLQSADAIVDQLGEILNTTRDALNQARKAYGDTEDGNVQALK